MHSPQQEWRKAVAVGYLCAFLLYSPIAIVGYYVYGSYLVHSSTILEAILAMDASAHIVIKICCVLMVIHIISAFPVLINPFFLMVTNTLV
jgi:hypothetical protein